MNKLSWALSMMCAIAFSPVAPAQEAVRANPDHEQMLASTDAHLAANKRLAYDFWRSILEGGHLELADKFMAPTYIQHNPNVPTGRAGFVSFFSKFVKPKPIETRIKAPLVAIVADGDLVVLSFVDEKPDPKDPKKTYTTTSFDMFRIQDGKISEHWDADSKQ